MLKKYLFLLIYCLTPFITVVALSYMINKKVNWVLAIGITLGWCVAYILFHHFTKKNRETEK